MDTLLQFLNNLQGTIQELQAKLANAQAEAQNLYNKGFADGVASVPVAPVNDKLYSQVEMDAALADLKSQLASMQAQIDELKLAQDTAVNNAVSALKSSLAEKYAALMVVEQQAETGFADLLK